MPCSAWQPFKTTNLLLVAGAIGLASIAAVPAQADEVTIVPPRVIIAPPAGVLLAPSAPPLAPPEVIPSAPDQSVFLASRALGLE